MSNSQVGWNDVSSFLFLHANNTDSAFARLGAQYLAIGKNEAVLQAYKKAMQFFANSKSFNACRARVELCTTWFSSKEEKMTASTPTP